MTPSNRRQLDVVSIDGTMGVVTEAPAAGYPGFIRVRMDDSTEDPVLVDEAETALLRPVILDGDTVRYVGGRSHYRAAFAHSCSEDNFLVEEGEVSLHALGKCVAHVHQAHLVRVALAKGDPPPRPRYRIKKAHPHRWWRVTVGGEAAPVERHESWRGACKYVQDELLR